MEAGVGLRRILRSALVMQEELIEARCSLRGVVCIGWKHHGRRNKEAKNYQPYLQEAAGRAKPEKFHREYPHNSFLRALKDCFRRVQESSVLVATCGHQASSKSFCQKMYRRRK